MLDSACVVLVLLWLTGMLTGFLAGGAIHVLLAIALILLILRGRIAAG